jgi:hypothetical protein
LTLHARSGRWWWTVCTRITTDRTGWQGSDRWQTFPRCAMWHRESNQKKVRFAAYHACPLELVPLEVSPRSCTFGTSHLVSSGGFRNSVLWLHGCPWLHGSVASWVRGFMGPWLHGSVASWVRRQKNSTIVRCTPPGTPPNPGVLLMRDGSGRGGAWALGNRGGGLASNGK